MEYRKQLLAFILEGRQQEMGVWMKEQPDLERLQIMNEFKEIIQELANESGMEIDDELDEFEEAVTDYQEKILDEQLASLKNEMTERFTTEAIDEAETLYKSIKKTLIESIQSNSPNAAELRKIAENMMQIEKENGLFDSADWQELL